MKCALCHHECPATAKFCEECGAGLTSQPLADDGTPAPGPTPPSAAALDAEHLKHAEPEVRGVHTTRQAAPVFEDRRQVTVLFVDISGFTALCARSDPEQVRDMLRRFYTTMETVVARYGGQVFDRIGDAVMAVFGAPVAHGNDPERALRAALDMHEAAAEVPDCHAQPLRLHVGVARGEVVAGVIGGDSAESGAHYSITGDTVNLAARLQSLATAGETLISDDLYRSASTLIEVDAHGAHDVKGLPSPVQVWRVRSLRPAARALSPFVGRQAEFARIVAALAALSQSGSGVTILIRGQAGIGKSRLVTEVRERAAAEGFAVPIAQVLDFGVARGKGAVPALLKTALGVVPDDEAACRLALRQAHERGVIVGQEGLFLASLLELSLSAAEIAVYNAIDNATRSRRETEALVAVLRRVARIRPMLLTVEDVHWASAEFLRQLQAIARSVADTPLILLMTSRVEDDPLDAAWRAALNAPPPVELMTLDLGPLRPHEAAALADTWTDIEVEIAQQCVARADGNPLFLEQLLRSPQACELTAVPPTVQSLVLERMDRLAPPQRMALQAASVLGKRFAANALRTLTGEPEDHCDVLTTADLIRPDGEAFQFTHALIQEAIYASILKSRRSVLHRQVAQWVGDSDPVLRAEHLDRANDPDAAAAYLSAARFETRRFRIDAAMLLVQRGITLAAEPGVKCELTLLFAELLREAGRSADSIDTYRTALDLAASDLQRCHAQMGVAAGCRVTGNFTEAIDALAEAQAIADRLELDVECSQIHNTRGNMYYARGDAPACEVEHTLALQHAKLSGDAECEVRALSGLGDAQLELGHLRQALESFRRCVALCTQQERIALEIPNRCMLGHCLRYDAQLGDASSEVRRAWLDAQRVGLVPAQVFALMTLATVLIDAGQFDEAEPACVDGIALARRSGARRFESSLRLSLADLRLRQGRRQEARLELDAALTLARETGMGFAGAATYGMMARAATDPIERARALHDGEALLVHPCLARSVLRFHVSAIEACIDAAEWDSVLRYCASLETFTHDEPFPWAMLLIERARALRELAVGQDRLMATQRLQRVRQDIADAQFGSALGAIDSALAAFPSAAFAPHAPENRVAP
ncbi:adenylate/guanylate cyclase domain-containing protein [Paraburkholderia sp. DHOC27]|uniref:adenylate/guanylate cyclase domain-containing protein n=1 Tax=Paraburkholderia sp. DHOC27 TaxID=2303330 RepID=UPI0015F2F0FB|nr:adenylate/guanylate cyclase domain-containing protein [Paraburkholderia sp. DHOC27]